MPRPVLQPEYAVGGRAVVLRRRAAEPKRIYVIEHAVISPHIDLQKTSAAAENIVYQQYTMNLSYNQASIGKLPAAL